MTEQDQINPCKYCGSRRHQDSKCGIKQKADLLLIGIPAEHLFDHVIHLDDVEDLPKIVGDIRDGRHD